MAVNKIKQYSGTFEYIYTPSRPGAYAANGGDITLFTSEIGGGGRNVKGATYRVHKFTSSSSITFDQAGYIDLLVVGGGGAGGASYNHDMGGGGGGGGLIERYNHYVDATTYSISVGAGGTPSNGAVLNARGGDSSFGNVVAFGGGRGNNRYATYDRTYMAGGSGGGGADNSDLGGSSIEGQGFDGGGGWSDVSGGGGGAGGSGGSPLGGYITPFGGAGKPTYFDNDTGDWMAGGGAGSYRNSRRAERGIALGGRGGGGDGGTDGDGENNRLGNVATYYGSGGAAGYSSSANWYYGGAGYKGIVIVRYLIT